MLTLWIVIICGKLALAVVLWWKRQQRVYPLFTTFATFGIIESAILFSLRHNGAAYFYAYWTMAVADVIFKLGALIELFHSALQTELIERQQVTRFYAAIAFLSATSFVTSFVFPSTIPVPLVAFIRNCDTGASLMLSLCIVAVVVVARIDGVYWLNRTRGIAYGFIIYLPVRVLAALRESSAGNATYTRLQTFEMVSFLLALGIWTTYFARPEISRISIPLETLVRMADKYGSQMKDSA